MMDKKKIKSIYNSDKDLIQFFTSIQNDESINEKHVASYSFSMKMLFIFVYGKAPFWAEIKTYSRKIILYKIKEIFINEGRISEL